MTAAGFGDISDANRYGNTVYVTEDEATIYFARPDNKLYAAQYAVPAPAEDYKVEIAGSDVTITPQAGDLEALKEAGVDTSSVSAVNTALATEIGTTGIPAWQALFLGVAPTTAGLEKVAIKSIGFDSNGKVVVEMSDDVTLKTGRGVDIKLSLQASDDLTNWTTIQTVTDTKAFTPVTPGSGETKKFYKVVVGYEASSN